MGTKRDLSDFKHGMVLGVLNISETDDLLGFSCTTVHLWFTEMKNREYLVSSSCMDENALLM